MQRANQNVLMQESIHKKKKLQVDLITKLEMLNDKLSSSMIQSVKKKETQLIVLTNKLKKRIQESSLKMSVQEEIREIKEEVSVQAEQIEQVPQKILKEKSNYYLETLTIKLAQPKNLDELEFFRKLKKQN
ncbi:unnamed protein product [Paramecium sonneborni]|uniref:Uncharacterized protein n=1 Tax=Paramecium sonneborni TaxID=65129 RepID=A0A8S1Q862_9CILI|nr:unnamed protein product [Paramecium sonneborni]